MKSKQNELETITKQIRRDIVTMAYTAGGGHLGCSLGIVDILTILYFQILTVHPDNPQWKERDKFILSKGHACSALYAVLINKGFAPRAILESFCKDGSLLAGHVTYQSLPGIEATAGSLGHGLSIGIGMALAQKKNGFDSKTYVLIGDGEAEEGSIWEGIMFAGHHKLANLILIVDNNDLQIMGKASEIINLDSFSDKLQTFGWQTVEVDGNNLSLLAKAFRTQHKSRPLAVIAKTVKGKGVSFTENKYEWHGKVLTPEEYTIALQELSST